MKIQVLGLVLLPLATGCAELPWGYCKEDWECHDFDNNPGRCLPSPDGMFCALPDKSCATGWRWKRDARDPYRSMCVDPSVPLDGGMDADGDQSTSVG